MFTLGRPTIRCGEPPDGAGARARKACESAETQFWTARGEAESADARRPQAVQAEGPQAPAAGGAGRRPSSLRAGVATSSRKGLMLFRLGVAESGSGASGVSTALCCALMLAPPERAETPGVPCRLWPDASDSASRMGAAPAAGFRHRPIGQKPVQLSRSTAVRRDSGSS